MNKNRNKTPTPLFRKKSNHTVTEEKAMEIKGDLMTIAAKHGLWVKVEEERKPELKTVSVQVSILVSDS